MTLAQKLIELSKDMSEDMLSEVIDFAEYLKEKNNKEHKKLVDEFIKGNEIALKEIALKEIALKELAQ
ncbi:DUF2281 domain-containing protein [Clostridium botulinum]|uniref:DUF2281 domain-containing protein n=1 Tax=Clostridium botulinum TaxID=1491 RepID=UPI0001F84D31|nr:DUF2281 domain-containing protein [Clostridium botulinum]NFB16296.1 DUF2281 domain-containing protein [Clostridium botulinum]NFB67182.1 DUF2281 domain-containing protein [Clostridium botulinum]NFB96771.1 DUF2281 domain-containing protein [Clostridium botulinum]NFC48261.1 DUF2281 domain-containing protein [Clostridium botulinum]NFC57470.1 DUF2281 domain-containing protein [Clostridium botulinum]